MSLDSAIGARIKSCLSVSTSFFFSFFGFISSFVFSLSSFISGFSSFFGFSSRWTFSQGCEVQSSGVVAV